MDKEQYQVLERKIKAFTEFKKEIVNQIIEELKKDCSVYSELDEKVGLFYRQFSWGKDIENFSEIYVEVVKNIEQEKSDLRIANHF